MSTLFDSDPQYREKAAIWRLMSLMPLYSSLAGGRIWRWFAINIPMEVVDQSGKFTSDIDIIARLYDFPNSREWIYKTWEVKVSLLCNNGTAKALHAGKTVRTMKQLNAYREFGSPDVSLLDIYLLEAGYLKICNTFPPPLLDGHLSKKKEILAKHNFGYQLLSFGHGKVDNQDYGLFAIQNAYNPIQTTVDVLPALVSKPREPFLTLVNLINDFFESGINSRRFFGYGIVFCRKCRQFQMINMGETYLCPECQSNLIAQT